MYYKKELAKYKIQEQTGSLGKNFIQIKRERGEIEKIRKKKEEQLS